MFQPANELERLLVAAADNAGDVDAARRFTDALLAAEVGWPLTPSGPVSMKINDRAVVPFFSSPQRAEEAIAQFREVPDVQISRIPARELFAQAVNNDVGLALNPFGGYGKEFLREEMSDLLRGVTPGTQSRTVEEQTSLLVGEPAHVPDGLIPALTQYLDSIGSIESATLAWVRWPDGLMGYLVVIVSTLPREQVTAGINDALAGKLDGRTADVLVETPQNHSTATNIAPFYPAG